MQPVATPPPSVAQAPGARARRTPPPAGETGPDDGEPSRPGGGGLPGPISTPAREGGAAPAVDAGGHRTWQRPLAWSTAAGAVLGAAVGGAALWIRSEQITNANDLVCNVDKSTNKPTPMNPNDLAHCNELVRNASNARLAAIIGFSAAGALAITSAILFVTAPSSSSPSGGDAAVGHASSRWIAACAPTLAATGVTCQLRF